MKKISKYFKSVGEGTRKIFPFLDLQSSQSKGISKLEERRQDIQLGRLIGIGNFSIVCAGSKWTLDEYVSVAVKIPRVDVQRGDNVQREIFIMEQLGAHNYVLGLISSGNAEEVGSRYDGIYILTPFCVNGSLKAYLIAESSKESEEQDEKKGQEIGRLFEAVKFSYQIASGMNYISSKNIIHGDLATRNVLLDERKICKISDFGLSRQLSSNQMETGERVEMKEKPWRWMPPEFLEDGLLTPSCDVWSYGVTLWEIFTFAKIPFQKLDWNDEFTKGIREGLIRLPKPDMADDEIFTMMEKCWNSEYKQRPGFALLLEFFQSRYSLFRSQLTPLCLERIENFQPTRMKPHVSSAIESEMGSCSELEVPKEEFHFEDEYPVVGETVRHLHRAVVYGKLAAVKIRQKSDFSSIQRGLDEVKILSTVGTHPYIVGFIGACTAEISKGIMYIAIEFCQNGSLQAYLRKYLGNCQIFLENDYTFCGNQNPLDSTELARFSCEIASAMSYLSTNQIIHNELGTRSVFLNENKTCKLSDFSLSRKMGDDGIYVKVENQPLPWRWMAPEALEDLKFSVESDVWAFGVTLWEIYSLGNIPYDECSWTTDFLIFIKRGLQLPQEERMSNEIYGKMQECWNLNPKNRPKFDKLYSFFLKESGIQYWDL